MSNGNEDDVFVIPENFYGWLNLETRMRPEGNRLIGEGRCIEYNQRGEVIRDTGWEPTGASLILDETKPVTRRMWDFLLHRN
jgi:hypothetical protein